MMKTPTPLIAGLIVGGMCLIGMLPLPYPYYPFLRVVVMAGAAVMIGCCIVRGQYLTIIPFAIAGLFFFGVKGLDKEVWAMIDLVAAGVFIAIGYWLANQELRTSS